MTNNLVAGAGGCEGAIIMTYYVAASQVEREWSAQTSSDCSADIGLATISVTQWAPVGHVQGYAKKEAYLASFGHYFQEVWLGVEYQLRWCGYGAEYRTNAEAHSSNVAGFSGQIEDWADCGTAFDYWSSNAAGDKYVAAEVAMSTTKAACEGWHGPKTASSKMTCQFRLGHGVPMPAEAISIIGNVPLGQTRSFDIGTV